jgi:hypothetical protein
MKKRTLGRPRRMWIDDIIPCRGQGKRMHDEVKGVAMDRDAWRKLTHQPFCKENSTNERSFLS